MNVKISGPIDYAKKYPGKLSYSTPGVGSHFHFAGALLKMHGVDLVHVPFKGGGPAVQATLGGEPLLTFGNLASMVSLIRDKRLKSVALIEKKPVPNDSTATLGEVLPGYEMPDAWFAFFGPARMPAPIIGRLNRDIAQAVNSPEMQPKLDELKMFSITGTPEDAANYLRFSIETYGKIAKAAGIQPE